MQSSYITCEIDHLVYASADLDSACDTIEMLLGVRPVPGGRHPDWGTHNALLGLGQSCYLELIAPDPAATVPARGFPLGQPGSAGNSLVTWVLRTANIERLAASASRAGIGIGAVQSGSRRRPDGTLLAWQLTDPAAMPLDGAVPFLIDWGETPHPASALPHGGTLQGLRIEHPWPTQVRKSLSVLGVEDLLVSPAPCFALRAHISAPAGDIVLS
jgi:hypothetical protein